MDYSRQIELFNPEKFGNTPVHVIGAGATGSWLTLFLAKMGIKNIHVYDFDEVEEHNLPNQVYRLRLCKKRKYLGGDEWDNTPYDDTDIGKRKVDALYEIIVDHTGLCIWSHDKKVTEDSGDNFSGVVFVLTDTMSSRKKIFDKYLKYNAAVKLLIETRMGLEHGRIYAIDPRNIKHIKEYEKTLYSDEEATISACGASQSIVATAVNIASRAAWKLIKWHNGFEYDNEVIIDIQNNNLLTRRFE